MSGGAAPRAPKGRKTGGRDPAARKRRHYANGIALRHGPSAPVYALRASRCRPVPRCRHYSLSNRSDRRFIRFAIFRLPYVRLPCVRLPCVRFPFVGFSFAADGGVRSYHLDMPARCMAPIVFFFMSGMLFFHSPIISFVFCLSVQPSAWHLLLTIGSSSFFDTLFM